MNQSIISKKEALVLGCSKRHQFLETILRGVKKIEIGAKHQHIYVYSKPGLGKTYSISKQLKDLNIPFLAVSSNYSMYAFGLQLSLIKFLNQTAENIIVFVDDCDIIFSTEENCNIMKNLLDGSRKFSYQKSMQSLIGNLSNIQRDSIEFHSSDNNPGFEVDCSNMTFIFTSNFKLPDDDLISHSCSNSRKAILSVHKYAIRTRCKVVDCEFSNEELWGWIADVALNTECLISMGLSEDDIVSILDFIWDNWDNLKERSIRLIEKMGISIKDYPNEYYSIWRIDHVK